MKNTKKIKIDDEIYEANTDFRVAIECNEIAKDQTIDNVERALSILYLIFGEKVFEHEEHQKKLLEWAVNYLSGGKKVEERNEEPDMDFKEDMDYIVASFQSDYGINLDEGMEWQRFNTLMNGLSYSEFGNCCILNRIRDIRTKDVSKISDPKQRQQVLELKERFALKKDKRKVKLTAEQEQSMEELNKIIGIE